MTLSESWLLGTPTRLVEVITSSMLLIFAGVASTLHIIDGTVPNAATATVAIALPALSGALLIVLQRCHTRRSMFFKGMVLLFTSLLWLAIVIDFKFLTPSMTLFKLVLVPIGISNWVIGTALTDKNRPRA